MRIFHAVAEVGSFTRAATRLALSQSAISRQIGALEEDLGVPLFHRHARGLLLTEQGEILLGTARDLATRVADVEGAISESKERASGHLRVNTTIGFGALWLTGHLAEFADRHPKITLDLLVTENELDLGMREADVAVRLQRPTQPDLVQRRLTTFHTHIYGSRSYLDAHGRPSTADDLDRHRLIAYGPVHSQTSHQLNWVQVAGRDKSDSRPPRNPTLSINNVSGMLRATESGVGLAALPDYLIGAEFRLEQVLPELEGPGFTAYFVYPDELRKSKRITVFRDFLLEKIAAQPMW